MPKISEKWSEKNAIGNLEELFDGYVLDRDKQVESIETNSEKNIFEILMENIRKKRRWPH